LASQREKPDPEARPDRRAVQARNMLRLVEHGVSRHGT
jgi:hypothetical protein